MHVHLPTHTQYTHFCYRTIFQLLELCALDRINQLSEVDCYVDILHCQLTAIQLLFTISEALYKVHETTYFYVYDQQKFSK